MPIRLALSLHAADDALRSQIMAVNDRYPLADVLAACERFYAHKHRRIFVEYVMLAGVNDRYEQALALAQALDARIFKVNLIPYNPTGSYDGSSREAIDAFRADEVLTQALGPELSALLVDFHADEWARFCGVVTDWERQMYWNDAP
jgi:adenine C2-methylase RlmN of 23S rRNA A2503 and tRNA A37